MLRDIKDDAPQVAAVIDVVRHAAPDILILADIDYDLEGIALGALADRIGGYPHRFSRRPNRGTPSGRDLDGDGRLGGPGDAEGYGLFSGQGGLAILSRFPLDEPQARDFSTFAWDALPEAIPPDGPTPTRLSTTAHWDVPVTLPDGARLHLLVWHATAPVFDGPEDRNGRRNHDEAAFWLAYLDGALPEPPPRDYVLAGIANADPHDGESRPGALMRLLQRVQDPRPASPGGAAAANADHHGPPELDTVDWPEGRNRPGNLRVDYVLPSRSVTVRDSGVVWPHPDDPFAAVVAAASRHRLVWVDIEMR